MVALVAALVTFHVAASLWDFLAVRPVVVVPAGVRVVLPILVAEVLAGDLVRQALRVVAVVVAVLAAAPVALGIPSPSFWCVRRVWLNLAIRLSNK